LINSYKKVSKPEWIYKSNRGDYVFSLSIIENDIFYGRSEGYVHGQDVIEAEKIIQQLVNEYLPFGESFYYISDLTDATGSSTKARNEHLHYRLNQIEKINLLIYANPNALLKVAIKAGRLFSNRLRKKVHISTGLDHSLSIIEQHRSDNLKIGKQAAEYHGVLAGQVPKIETDPGKNTLILPDNIDDLKSLVTKLHDDKSALKKYIKRKSDQLIKIMSGITWGDDFSTDILKTGDDDFSDLLAAFNLLQVDLLERMTAQKKAREDLQKKEKQHEILFNKIPDIVMLHDKDTHRFVDFNERALKYGYTREELLAMTPFDLHPPGEIEKVEKKIDEINDAPGAGNRWQHVMKDGTRVDVEIMTSEIDYNGKPAFVSIVRNITERRQFEEILIKKQKEAEAASRSKSEFLANMSHEIRTPMNGVIGILDILSESELSQEQAQFLLSAQHSADALLIVINDILDFSKIEAGKLEIEIIDFDLCVTLDSLSDVMGVKTFEKGVNFACLVETDVPVLLKGDPSRLRQVLTNLSGNAVKFTESGEIFIRVSLENEIDDRVTLLFEVIDTGIGIPQDKINFLFDSFTQVDASTTRQYGGTGLGLAISKQLVELMGGKIGVKSQLNKGSTFYFTAAFKKQTQSGQCFMLMDEIQGKKILVVDDNVTNQLVFKKYLESWGCLFDTATNGNDALKILKKAAHKNPYDLALIDMQMPNMSGATLGKLIKDHKDIRETPLLMLSSVAARGDAQKLNKIGFSGFLTKPIKKQKLFDTIRTTLSMGSHIDAQTPIITSYKVEEIKKAQPCSGEKLKILLVEDNKINQKVATKMLESMAKEIVLAEDGREAVSKFKNDKFDIIFMDIQMPVMDGKKATKKIREIEIRENRGHTLIIALTANAMKGDRESLLKCGADEYLSKPIKRKHLIQILETVGLL